MRFLTSERYNKVRTYEVLQFLLFLPHALKIADLKATILHLVPPIHLRVSNDHDVS